MDTNKTTKAKTMVKKQEFLNNTMTKNTKFNKSTIKNLTDNIQTDVKQLILGLVAAVVIISLIIAQLATKNITNSSSMVVNLLLGTALGFVLARGMYGFAGAFRNPIQSKNYSLSKSVVIFLGILTTLVSIVSLIQAQSTILPSDKGSIIEQNSGHKISFMFIIGGLLFGIGMIMAGGCASGTLQDIGVGAVGALIALWGWMFGVFVGFIFKAPMLTNWICEGIGFNLFNEVGIFGGWVINLTIIFLIYLLLSFLENKIGDKKNSKTRLEVELENKEDFSKNQVSFISNNTFKKTWFNIFQKKWALTTTTILLSIIGVLSMMKKGGWGISTTYGLWGSWILEDLGVDILGIEFAGSSIKNGMGGAVGQFNQGFWNHQGSMYNISILLGAVMAIALASKFRLNYKMKPQNIAIYLFGGFIMGFGTRLSGGCNIGALVDPIAAGELTGYMYGILLGIGAWIGLKFMVLTKSL